MQRKTASRWRIGGPLAADSADTPARVEFAPMTRPSRHRARSSTLGPLALALATTALPSTGHADAPALEASRTAPETTPRLASYLDASWELERVIDTHGFHIERYRQRIEGLRVDGATAVVRARRDGSVDLVTVESPAQTGATVTGRTVHTPRAEVLRAALEEVPLGFVIDRLEPAEAVLAAADPFEATPRLVVAHRVVVRGRALDEAVSVLVEDSSLRVLRIDDLVRDARGLVFERNTVSDMGMTSEVELPAQSVPGTLTSSAFTVRSCMVSAGGACTPVPRAVPDADGNFLLAPDPESFEDGFTEVMAFYHASLAADRLERDHGFRWRCSAEGPARDDSMQIFTNFTDSPGRAYANAAYVAGSRAECGYLLFGQSGMQDFASDADVVYHELGHAVTDQLSAIVGFAVDSLGMHYDPLAVNEGTSDYWAATIQGDPRVGESLAGLDGIGRSAALRDLDGALRCPNDLFGEGHFDGRIWAGAFWDLRTELGAEKVDALLFATIASIGTAPSLRAAGESAAATADSLVTMGTLTAADGARVREVLGERGLLDCRRVTPLDDGEERGAFSGIALLTGGIGNDVAPIHYSLTLPADATSATIEVTPGTLLGQYAVLARSGSPVGFRGTGIQLDQRDEIGHAGMVTYHASSPAFAPCTTMYFAIESMDLDRGENLFLVQASVERSGDPAARCPDPEPDAGVPDAAMDPDAGTAPDAAMTTTEMPGNCGCRARPVDARRAPPLRPQRSSDSPSRSRAAGDWFAEVSGSVRRARAPLLAGAALAGLEAREAIPLTAVDHVEAHALAAELRRQAERAVATGGDVPVLTRAALARLKARERVEGAAVHDVEAHLRATPLRREVHPAAVGGAREPVLARVVAALLQDREAVERPAVDHVEAHVGAAERGGPHHRRRALRERDRGAGESERDREHEGVLLHGAPMVTAPRSARKRPQLRARRSRAPRPLRRPRRPHRPRQPRPRAPSRSRRPRARCPRHP
jgi:hypothetical protein